MSHTSFQSTKLKVVDTTIFGYALTAVANKKKRGSVMNYIHDWNRNPQDVVDGCPVLGAIFTDECSRGVGAIIRNGALEFVADEYGCAEAAKKIKEEIVSTYETLALIKALEMVGMEVSCQEADGVMVIQGVEG